MDDKATTTDVLTVDKQEDAADAKALTTAAEATVTEELTAEAKALIERAAELGEREARNLLARYENYRHPGVNDGDEGVLADVQPADVNKGTPAATISADQPAE
jgi:hypothetical protein